MKSKFLISFTTFIIFISMLGCAGSPIRTGWQAEKNRSNMLKLKIGMTTEQVLTLMGNPYKTESYQVEGKPLEFWLYLTEGKNIYEERDVAKIINFLPRCHTIFFTPRPIVSFSTC